MRREAPPDKTIPFSDKTIPFSVDTIMVYNGRKWGFVFTPRCPASRLYETAGKGIGIKVTRVEHQPSGTSTERTSIPNDPNKWVLEDYGVKNGSIIHIFGEPSKEQSSPPPDMVQMRLLWKDKMKEPIEFAVHKRTSIGKLIKSIELQFDVIPHTVKLSREGNPLTKLDEIPVWKEGELITMEGTFFPISLFGGEFATNVGLYPSTECVICLEPLKQAKPFDCGHVNVCSECWDDESTEKCPVCK